MSDLLYYPHRPEDRNESSTTMSLNFLVTPMLDSSATFSPYLVLSIGHSSYPSIPSFYPAASSWRFPYSLFYELSSQTSDQHLKLNNLRASFNHQQEFSLLIQLCHECLQGALVHSELSNSEMFWWLSLLKLITRQVQILIISSLSTLMFTFAILLSALSFSVGTSVIVSWMKHFSLHLISVYSLHLKQ